MKPTILVVDDAPENIDVLRGILHEQYVLRPAISGALALRLVLVKPMPELILLDVMMPGMDGYEVCRRLKADPRTSGIAVIFITAKTQAEDEVQGLSLGAADYLTKPVVPAIVRARVHTQFALRQAQCELEQKNLILNDEKELLEEIVTRMNTSSPFDARGLRRIQKSLENTAGDIVLSACRPDGVQYVLVGDFSGHGLSAAFSGPLVSWMFYHLTAESHELSQILIKINRALYRQLPTPLYMAASALALSAERNQVKIWNYGLPPVLCLDDSLAIQRVKSSGLPLGLVESVETFDPHVQRELLPSMCIYQYSDGITEATSPDQEGYGQARLEALLVRIYREKLPLEVLWDELDVYCDGQGLTDDALLVEVIGK
ncbi:MAG: SpoIIE family protein phosphatase [Gallionella sp.]